MEKKKMVTGNIVTTMLLYTIPLVIGNIFQLLYSTVDMAIVGLETGSIGVDAIGAVNPIINIISFLLIGLTNGASILMSEFYGGDDEKTLKKEIGLCVSAISIVAIVLSLGCIILTNPLLDLLHVQDVLRKDASAYLITCMSGMLFLGIYNIYYAALRSIGDSTRPLIFLVLSCVLKIGFDFLFVKGFHLGVFGVALSTVISQIFTMIVCIVYSYLKMDLFKLKLQDFKIEKDLFLRTCRYAIASAMQQVVLQVGKGMIQGEINKMTIEEQAGYNIAVKIDDYAIAPAICIGHAIAVFLAQNRGAKKTRRVKKGFLYGIGIEVLFSSLMCVAIFFLKRPFSSLFTKDEEAIINSCLYLFIMSFLYIFPGLTNGVQAYFRGLGNLRIVFFSSTVNIVGRVIACYILLPKLNIKGAALSTMWGWICMLTFEVPLLVYFWVKNIKLPKEE